ncbi:uncharacterized protein Z518_00928 [Rhinocladiella mackenziei CBS 650.93]|uniref:Beta-lactamase-related domain-containing protein n=1 Tax=Rhinocladiella mackenziei CBS 650.93 TaxID=1442369 RepID=A0A0D2G520_9EURO|nr:uncharacterized protein Z518_00928 [Rhinocladiella mackenziei CBS 650.93]KIX09847.1 hypothetical protein Z518_00928 [Rhinocladiella mackenziei CBS 650.93]
MSPSSSALRLLDFAGPADAPQERDMKQIIAQLKALSHVIGEICQISGAPGVSVGVLHHGTVIHQMGFGYRDVSKQIVPDENTTYVIGSLTKAFTAALLGNLVDEGKLQWDTPVHDILPSFRRSSPYLPDEITITDLLSHRSGIAPYDSLWIGSNNDNLLSRDQCIAVLAYAPQAASVRTELLYNNFAYDVLGQMVEKTSDQRFSSYLHRQLLEPLSMSRTFFGSVPANDENVAIPYATLTDASAYPLPAPLEGDNVSIGAAGGIRSTVSDLLTLYNAFNLAAQNQIEQRENSGPAGPLKQMKHLWRPLMPLSLQSLREFSYAAGWIRVQLPAVMGPPVEIHSKDPVVGKGLPSRLAVFHQGSIPGYRAYTALLPETNSGVVVLSNSLGLTNHARWIGEMLVETLLGNKVDSSSYVALAKTDARRRVEKHDAIIRQLEQESSGQAPCRPLGSYTGKYWNAINNFCIEIFQKEDNLYVSFQGRKADTFMLLPFQNDSFYWKLTYDDAMKLARDADSPKAYYILRFSPDCHSGSCRDSGPGEELLRLRWKHDDTMQDDGEIFAKAEVLISQRL